MTDTVSHEEVLDVVRSCWSTHGRAVDEHGDRNFFSDGGDSLSGARLMAALSSHFSLRLGLRLLMANPTMTQLAAAVTAVAAEQECHRASKPFTLAAQGMTPGPLNSHHRQTIAVEPSHSAPDGDHSPIKLRHGLTPLATMDYRQPEIRVPVVMEVDGQGSGTVAEKLEHNGFVIVKLTPSFRPHRALELMANALNLGEPYVPALYRTPGVTSDLQRQYVRIEDKASGHHPSFDTALKQLLHVDGIVDPLGTICVSALYCIQRAESGGATFVFNSTAAYVSLRANDPEAAEVLLRPDVLCRRSTLPGVNRELVESAFIEGADGSISTRFSLGPNCEWHTSLESRPALERAVSYLSTLSEKDGRYRASIVLEPGECLLLRNDRVSHGREAYRDSASAPRSMLRALYTQVPQ